MTKNKEKKKLNIISYESVVRLGFFNLKMQRKYSDPFHLRDRMFTQSLTILNSKAYCF